MFTAKERLYRTADGRVVGEGDPDSAFLLVAQGGTLSDEDAAKYGLNKAEPEPESTPAVMEPEPAPEPDDKAILSTPENKAVKNKSTK